MSCCSRPLLPVIAWALCFLSCRDVDKPWHTFPSLWMEALRPPCLPPAPWWTDIQNKYLPTLVFIVYFYKVRKTLLLQTFAFKCISGIKIAIFSCSSTFLVIPQPFTSSAYSCWPVSSLPCSFPLLYRPLPSDVIAACGMKYCWQILTTLVPSLPAPRSFPSSYL